MERKQTPPSAALHWAVFLILAAATVFAGYRSYVSHRRALKATIHLELSQIAKLKAAEVAAWRLERLGDANVAATSAKLMPAMQKLLDGENKPDQRRGVSTWMEAMRSNYQYVGLALLDRQGEIKLSNGELMGTAELYRELSAEVEMGKGAILRETPKSANSPVAHMTLAVALGNPPGERTGSLILTIDPRVHFYPVILKWTSPSQTAETVLVKRDGNDALFLSETRGMSEATMKLRTSLSNAENPAARAVSGAEGAVDGTDATGTKIYGVAARVPNSDWIVIAKIEQEEARQGLYHDERRLGTIFGLLLLLIGTGIGLIRWHQLSVFYCHQYEAEREKRALSHHYDYLTRFANDTILLLDDQGRILEANERAMEMLGYSNGELIGSCVKNLRPQETKNEFEKTWEELRQKKSLIFETKIQRKDGSTFPGEISVRRLEVDGQEFCQSIIRDETERKCAEIAVRESNERFRAVFENAAIGIALVDRDGRAIKRNAAYAKMLGYDPEELACITFEDVTHPEDRAWGKELYEELMSGKRGSFTVEKRYIKKNGEVAWGVLTVSLIRDAEGKPQYAIGMAEDITERKKLEEQFRQSQKLEGIGKLAGGVAHDFNNLLTVIKGYCDMVLDQMERTTPIRRQMEEIQKAAERATSLTQQLLAFSRRQVIQPRALNLNALVAESEKFLGRLVGDDIAIVTEFKTGEDRVMADSSQLQQVLMNLVVNARDAMPDGGILKIVTASAEGNEFDALGQPAERYVVLTVSDAGSGMDAETQKHAFEPFYTTKRQGKGTGLGLSTVYGIVKQAGGQVKIESEPGQGTTVTIFLPLTDTPVIASMPAPERRQLRGKEVILVVEDQENVRALAIETLKNYGYTVLEAANGAEALQVARGRQGTIDLLLTDLLMPGMNGKELAEKLKSERSEIAILFMSGYNQEVISHKGVLHSGVEYLPKPFGPAELAAKVRDVLVDARKKTILVVDDEAAIRGLFEAMLGGKYRVLVASDGKEALRMVANARDVDLVITDLVMPNQEGIETIRALREKHSGMRIFAMSGAFDGQFLKTAQLLGADATLTKPIEASVLYELVGNALN